MAALALGVVAGVLLAYIVFNEWRTRDREVMVREIQALRPAETQPAALTDPLYGEMLARLLDVALPKREEAKDAEVPGHNAEYEPPLEPVGDWTDPFIGLERPLVGGLAPGQAIPGIGDQATDPSQAGEVWAANWDDHPLSRGMEPVDADTADELFAEWERTTMRDG